MTVHSNHYFAPKPWTLVKCFLKNHVWFYWPPIAGEADLRMCVHCFTEQTSFTPKGEQEKSWHGVATYPKGGNLYKAEYHGWD